MSSLSRSVGVIGVLITRGITLPQGSPDDPPSAETVCGLGNRKNAAFGEVLARDGVDHLIATGLVDKARVGITGGTGAERFLEQ